MFPGSEDMARITHRNGEPVNALAMDEASRMAEEAGFGGDFYHASFQDIDEFKPGYDDGLTFLTDKSEMANNWLGKGKYRGRLGAEEEIKALEKAQSADRKTHFDFEKLDKLEGDEFNAAYDEMSAAAKKANPIRAEDVHGAIYPVRTNVKKTFDPEKNYKEMEDFLISLDGKNGVTGMKSLVTKGHHKKGNWVIYENKDVVEELKKRGYDSMRITEDVDGAQDTLAIFDPKNIRSKFAKFDPAKRNSANILAAAAPFAAAGLANSLYRPESDKKL
jgi:hypothetical protein